MATTPPPVTPEPAKKEEGWVYLSNAPKFHYIRNGKSLCRRWGYLGSTFEDAQGGFNPKQDCAACWKRLEKEKAAK